MKIKVFGSDMEIPIDDEGEKKSSGGMAASFGGLLILFVLAFAVLSPMMIASVGAGERGVRFNRFVGGVEEIALGEGWHIKAPWVQVIPYTIKTQAYTMSLVAGEGQVPGDDRITAISRDGLSVDFDITMLYHIDAEKVPEIHQTIGKEYEFIIIRPLIRTSIRDVAGEFVAMEMHTKRSEISDMIFSQLEPTLKSKNIILEQVLVRSIIRPKQIERAIEDKLEAEQAAQKMEFVIQKEEREAERKKIEAMGIADANEIIGMSLTPNYLSWYWITNLDKHSSVIYVPVSEQGFPMFKDIDSGIEAAAKPIE